MYGISKPMDAAKVDDNTLHKLPERVAASPKLDGIRVLIHPEHGPVTKSFKPVPNDYIRVALNREDFVGLDGEILLEQDSGFNTVQSAVMSQHGRPAFEFWVFDYFGLPHETFFRRAWEADRIIEVYGGALKRVPQVPIYRGDVPEVARSYVQEGYEGVVVRSWDGIYKEGRSTLKEGHLVKYKDFLDAEGRIVDFVEFWHNTNEQERDELGYAKRSDAKEGKVGADTLGALILDTDWGEVRVGSGFDFRTRAEIWQNREAYRGRLVRFKYQEPGMQEKPRFPIFLGFRDERDMSPK